MKSCEELVAALLSHLMPWDKDTINWLLERKLRGGVLRPTVLLADQYDLPLEGDCPPVLLRATESVVRSLRGANSHFLRDVGAYGTGGLNVTNLIGRLSDDAVRRLLNLKPELVFVFDTFKFLEGL